MSPILACSALPHSGHGYVGPAEVLLVELCEKRAFSEPPRSCVFLTFLLRYESYCATVVDPGHRICQLVTSMLKILRVF